MELENNLISKYSAAMLSGHSLDEILKELKDSGKFKDVWWIAENYKKLRNLEEVGNRLRKTIENK